jgi:hypothetical protein
MATMIPNACDEFKTEGEQRFYRFLELVAKPDQKFTTWYLPDIEGREPDFILFSEDVGLVIFEVKDWALEQIKEANPRQFVLRMGKKRKSLKNPLYQAREYFESLMTRIQIDGKLLSREPAYRGKVKVPIDYGVVFPNIYRDSFCQSGLDKVISPKRAFFWDDVHAASLICSDPSGECFRQVIREMFPPRFRFQLSPPEYHHIKQLLFPVVRIDQPQRDTCSYIDPLERVTVLDDRQESVARARLSGRHLVSGPSGSGKTLILVQKAAFLKQYVQSGRVLFLCYNISLVNYIKRLLTQKGVPLGSAGVEVLHFFELCTKILGEKIRYENEDADYYQLVVEETLAKLEGSDLRYDAILVDEGQDFTAGMNKVVEGLLDEKSEAITIALDTTQNIYGRNLAWRENFVEKNARVDDLAITYRNTSEIKRFALKLTTSADSCPDLLDTYCETHGPKPELVAKKELQDVISYIANTIRLLYDHQEYPLSEMAVLYTRCNGGVPGMGSLPEEIAAALEAKGIMSNWLSEDYRSKQSYDITTDRVAISTIHSAKGLDYACVFVVGLDLLSSPPLDQKEVQQLAYTGITRARHRLIIPYVQSTELIAALGSCLSE